MPTADYARLPFPEAIDYLAGKINLDTDSWRDGQGVVQDAAFTVARAKGQLLEEIRAALDKAIAEGKSVDEFVKSFDSIASRWADDWNLRGDKGWRGQLIYEQNLRQAYAAGRYKQMTDPEVVKLRPYWQWRHGGSARPRLAHLAMDGRVYPAGSVPMVPWGFGCQCQIFSLSQRDLDREGLTPETYDAYNPVEWVDPSTGQTRRIVLKPDQGFENTPGQSSAVRRWEVLQAAMQKADPRIADQVRREVMLLKEGIPAQVNATRLADRRAEIVAAAGEDLVAQAEANLQKALEPMNIYVQVSPDAIPGIIQDGRLKTLFEIPTKPNDEVETRRAMEKLLFDYPSDLPAYLRPVSGALSGSPALREAPQLQPQSIGYGDVVLGFKPTVRNRATYTLNDSLTAPPGQFGKEVSWQPSPLNRPNIASFVSRYDSTPGAMRDRVQQFAQVKTVDDLLAVKADAYKYNFYMEAQIHGGIAASEIATITYQSGTPSQAVLDWAKANQIEVEYGRN
jgi:hypothetical protein